MIQMASPLNRGSCPAGTDEVHHRLELKFSFIEKAKEHLIHRKSGPPSPIADARGRLRLQELSQKK